MRDFVLFAGSGLGELKEERVEAVDIHAAVDAVERRSGSAVYCGSSTDGGSPADPAALEKWMSEHGNDRKSTTSEAGDHA